MKNILFLSLLLLAACSKKSSNSPTTGGNDPKTPDGSTSACVTQPSDVNSLSIFPSDNAWNADISNVAVDDNSAQILSAYAGTGLHPDFGSGLWDGAPIGIPFTVVCASQPKVSIVYRKNSYDGNYGDESDPGPYPIPLNAPIEGNATGDAHVIAVDKDNGILYELYNASINNGHWEASSGAVFHFNSDALRPDGWTSADAAGLPIFPGLVRYDEVAKGAITHALRFTLAKNHVKPGHIAPARHDVASTGGQYSIPFGAKIRLKASVDITGYPATVQVILKAMKKYGLILADIGSDMYVSGAPDNRWNNDDLSTLNKIKASDFEVVKS
ncbi:MAG TPA: hypothetical protein VHE34_05180 [Puia sp.]|uniref:hypothetical protein n=1 Tax=Puia sp. TaxID=2045100 RepID=UPI002B51F43E|nr:hypothetical protein [Puia sp.]HVU94593.1 hypothetical protein [Puia sp.]